MSKRVSIYFVCGAGLGSSLACQMEAEEVLMKAGIRAQLHHEGISAVPGIRTDIVVSAENFKSQIDKYELDPSIRFVYLHNIVDKGEIEQKLVPVVREVEAQA